MVSVQSLQVSTTPPLGVPGSFCGLTWQQEFLVMPMTRDDQVDPIPVEQRWQLLHWLWLQIKLEVGESSAPKTIQFMMGSKFCGQTETTLATTFLCCKISENNKVLLSRAKRRGLGF